MNTKLRALFETIGPGSPARYLSDTETLRLTVFNAASGVRVALRGRKVDENGESRFASNEITPTTARAASIGDVQPGAGWLVGAAAIVVGGSPVDGQTYAVLSIGIGAGANFTETEVLAAGTISAASRLSWPGSPIEGPLDGAGALRSITGTTPGAGAEFSETVPTGARWNMIALRAVFTASGVAGNRFPGFLVDDGANVYAHAYANGTTAAGGTLTNSLQQGIGLQAAGSPTFAQASLPADNRMGSGHRIRSNTSGILAGDTWTLIQYLVREWIEGN